MTARLKGRAAIVTGAGSGIGEATARLIAADGGRVLAVDLPASGVAETFLNADSIEPFPLDITGEDAPSSIIGAALERFSRLDILVNNAGIGHSALVETHTDEDWDRVLGVNVRAPFRLAREAIPALKASPAGRIVNVASVIAEGTDYGLAAYCAAKAGVAGLTRTLALELGKFGITANYVLPGAILTGMTRDSFARDDVAEVWARKSALRRLGAPEDVARGIVFLTTDEAAFITGHGLNVDGGLMLRV
ncbi:MAG: SDR family NAD(P)-dependent oxidoreductase [Alphaproteobacteria bacterium]